MKAVVGDTLPPDIIKLLIDRDADVNAKSSEGFTALDFAKRANNPVVIDMLVKAGAVSTELAVPDLEFVSDNTIAVREPTKGDRAIEVIRGSRLNGDADMHTVNGSVKVSTIGTALASTVNGSLDVTMGRADFPNGAKFSIEDDSHVTIIANYRAQIRRKCMFGGPFRFPQSTSYGQAKVQIDMFFEAKVDSVAAG
jgi:hypothetical protein